MKKLQSKAENILFAIVERLPERFIPKCAMEWMGRYLDSRMRELSHDQVKANWQKADLEKQVNKLKEM